MRKDSVGGKSRQNTVRMAYLCSIMSKNSAGDYAAAGSLINLEVSSLRSGASSIQGPELGLWPKYLYLSTWLALLASRLQSSWDLMAACGSKSQSVSLATGSVTSATFYWLQVNSKSHRLQGKGHIPSLTGKC